MYIENICIFALSESGNLEKKLFIYINLQGAILFHSQHFVSFFITYIYEKVFNKFNNKRM